MDEIITDIEITEDIIENNTKETVEQLNEILLNTQEQCMTVVEVLSPQIKKKDELIDKLHNELEYYKNDNADRYITEVLKSIIKIRKDVKRVILSPRWDDMSSEDFKREFTYLFEDLSDLLDNHLIDEIKSNPGEEFNAAIHKAKIEFTDDLNLDKKVKESIDVGYIKKEKVILPEKVIVYQYKKGE